MCQAIMRVRGVHGAGYDDPMEDRARIGEQSANARPARGLTWSAPFPAMETAMNTDFPRRTLGRQGPTVSAIGLGCMGMSDFYGPSEESTNLAVLDHALRSEEHTSELQSLMRISYAVFCLKKKTYNTH